MGKATNAKRRPPPERLPSGLDATPERMAHGEHEVVPSLPEKGQPLGYARKFRASHLDRLHKSGALTWVQHYAGNWYRETHKQGAYDVRVVAAYGEHTGAGEAPSVFGYGLPRQEAQARARRRIAVAREQWPIAMRGFMDRLLIHDSMPKYGGRAAMRNLTEIRNGLDILAAHLRITRD